MRKRTGWLALGVLLALGGEAFGQHRGVCGGGSKSQLTASSQSQQLQAYQRQFAAQSQLYQAQLLQAQQLQVQLGAQQLVQAQQLQAKMAQPQQLRGGN